MRWREQSAPSTVGAHETTTRHVGALYPLLADTTPSAPGVLIGLDLLGGPFTYDPFELYAAGVLTNPNAVVFGQIGRGKSALIKTYLARQLAFGRAAFVLDPKGEYGALARACGTAPLDLRAGGPLRLNPLDLVAGTPAEATAQRLGLLDALGAASMERGLLPRERASLEVALDEVVHLRATPTLPDVVDRLLEPSAQGAAQLATTAPELAEEGRDLALALRRLVRGDLAGLFDAPTSPTIDLDAPLLCLDLSALYGSAALGLLMVCAASWLQGAVRRRAARGDRSIVVIDEAWAILRDVAVARWLQSSWKLSRAWGVANMAVLHRLSDLSAVGAQDSEERHLAEGILLDSETRIIYSQPAGEAEAATLLGLTAIEREVVGRLGRGVALWKVGSSSAMVRHLLGPGDALLVDSDAAMRER